MHVTKPLPVNLAISGEDLLLDFLSAFPSKKVARRARSARRATYLLGKRESKSSKTSSRKMARLTEKALVTCIFLFCRE